MSSQYIKVLVPPPVVSPRGARWAADAAAWIARAFSSRRAHAVVSPSIGVQWDAACSAASDVSSPERDSMSANASSQLAQWWVHGVNAVDRARPVVSHHTTLAMQLGVTRNELSSALAARLCRWAHRFLERLWQRDESAAQDPLALARRVEREMPNLAAELRFFALHRPEAPG